MKEVALENYNKTHLRSIRKNSSRDIAKKINHSVVKKSEKKLNLTNENKSKNKSNLKIATGYFGLNNSKMDIWQHILDKSHSQTKTSAKHAGTLRNIQGTGLATKQNYSKKNNQLPTKNEILMFKDRRATPTNEKESKIPKPEHSPKLNLGVFEKINKRMINFKKSNEKTPRDFLAKTVFKLSRERNKSKESIDEQKNKKELGIFQFSFKNLPDKMIGVNRNQMSLSNRTPSEYKQDENI